MEYCLPIQKRMSSLCWMLESQFPGTLLLLEIGLHRVVELFLLIMSEAGAEHREIGRRERIGKSQRRSIGGRVRPDSTR